MAYGPKLGTRLLSSVNLMAHIDEQTFCNAWNGSESVQECADQLGIAYGTASNRATRLRKRGVKLKRIGMPRRPNQYTFDQLEAAVYRRWRKGAQRPIDRLWERIRKAGEDDCWPWIGQLSVPNHTGFQYGHFWLTVERRYVNFKAHRLIWALDRRQNPMGKVIRHTCDNPLCCNPKHMVSGTQIDNVRDKVERNRQRQGADVNTAKLTPNDVRAIRASRKGNAELGRIYGLNASNIYLIRRGDKWKSVEMESP